MTFGRPTVPSPGLEVLCFLMSGAGILAGLAYSLWSASSALVDWSEVLPLTLMFCVAVAPLVLLALVLRWHRRKKRAALSEYERILAGLVQD